MLIHEALWMLGTKVFRKRLNVNFTPHFSSFFPFFKEPRNCTRVYIWSAFASYSIYSFIVCLPGPVRELCSKYYYYYAAAAAAASSFVSNG